MGGSLELFFFEVADLVDLVVFELEEAQKVL